MPTIRYQIKNEYALADPALYGAADKEDPEALLEGVALAGLVGILRQLGDLAEFAAEIFHDLHEEVMATSSRGHMLLLRVQQLEVEFPAIEKNLFNKEQPEFYDSVGIDWHPNLQIDQNMVTREDMPRFVLDCYEESRGPPRLFVLDKFDSAEDGACLKRYSNPSFFKTKFTPSENTEAGFHGERRSHKNKKKIPLLKNGTIPEVQNPLLVDNKFEHLAAEKVLENQQINRRRLKRRHLNDSMKFGRSYMQSILGTQPTEGTELSSNSVGDSQEKIEAINSTESSPTVCEIIVDLPKERLNVEVKSQIESCTEGVETLLPPIQSTDDKEKPEIEFGKIENSVRTFPVDSLKKTEVSECSQSKSSSSLNDYRTDDVASELDNYLDALATMESEIETDTDTRAKLVQNTFIKGYPNSSLEDKEQARLTQSKSHSGEISCQSDEKLLHDLAELLTSECSSEVSPRNFTDHHLDANKGNEMGSSNELIKSQTSENESSSCSYSADLAIPEETKSAYPDPDANGIEKDKITGECSDHEVEPPVRSEIQNFETNVFSKEYEPNEKIADDDPNLRSENSKIDLPASLVDQPCLKLQTDDDSLETNYEVPKTEESIADCNNTLMVNGVESAPSLHVGNKDSLLEFPITENQGELQGSIFQEKLRNSMAITPVDDRSSTGSTQGLFEVKESCLSPSASNCSDVAGGSDNDSTSAERSRKYIRSEATISGVRFQESFITNHVELMPNGSDLESSDQQKPSNAACILESFSVSNSSYQELVHQVKPFEIADENIHPSNGGSLELSLNLHQESESESTLSDVQSQIDATSKVSGDNDCRLSETVVGIDDVIPGPIDQMNDKPLANVSPLDLEIEDKLLLSSDNSSFISGKDDAVDKLINQRDENLLTNVSPPNLEAEARLCGSFETSSWDPTKSDVIHDPIDLMENKFLTIVSPQDIEAKERLQSSETSNFHSTKNDVVHEPMDKTDKKFGTIVSPQDIEANEKLLQSSETSNFHSTKNDVVHEPMDQTDKKFVTIVSPQDIEANEKLLQSSETSNFHSTMNDVVHEPTDQVDKKLLTIVSPWDMEANEKHIRSSETSNFHSTMNDVVHEPIDQVDKKLLTTVSPRDVEANEKLIRSSETSNFHSTMNDVVHEPIDQVDKKLLTTVSPRDMEANEKLIRSSETSNFHSNMSDVVHEHIDQRLLTIVSSQDSETQKRQLQSYKVSSFGSSKDDHNNVRHLEIEGAHSGSSNNQLSREPEAVTAFLLKEDSTHRFLDRTGEIFWPDKSEKEEKRLERDGSMISSPGASKDLSEATGRSVNTHDSKLQYPSDLCFEILESCNRPDSGLPSVNQGIQELDEDPPPPPLPPIKWRMGKLHPQSIPSVSGMNSTLQTSFDKSRGSMLMGESPLLPVDTSQDTQTGLFSASHRRLKIEDHQEALMKENFEVDANYMPQFPITTSYPMTTAVQVSKYPERLNPFFNPLQSAEAERTPKDRIIEGYYSDTTLATETVPQGLLSYQGFHMYASEDEPFAREEYQQLIRRPSSLLNRPRDPLIEAVAAHDKSTLRRVSELAQTSSKPEAERNNPLLEQIRNKSFNLKPTAVAKPIMKAPPTNLKVAAILEKANSIRLAVAGSDEDDDGDSWSDS